MMSWFRQEPAAEAIAPSGSKRGWLEGLLLVLASPLRPNQDPVMSKRITVIGDVV